MCVREETAEVGGCSVASTGFVVSVLVRGAAAVFLVVSSDCREIWFVIGISVASAAVVMSSMGVAIANYIPGRRSPLL